MSARTRSSQIRRTTVVLAGAALAASALVVLPSQAAPGHRLGASAAPTNAWTGVGSAPSHVVTLLTGDTVRVSDAAGGQFAVAIEPAADGRAFTRYTDAAGDLHVVPVAAAAVHPRAP